MAQPTSSQWVLIPDFWFLDGCEAIARRAYSGSALDGLRRGQQSRPMAFRSDLVMAASFPPEENSIRLNRYCLSDVPPPPQLR
jgi:hypothetical protein